jgi:glycosyltransferase involved in cell wall biosynthesis
MATRPCLTARNGSLSLNATICICTRNRPKELEGALASISRSSVAPTQVIVSDDSDDDRVASVVATQALPITYTSGPRSGLGANRNNAILEATGDYVIFLDDDARLGADFLGEMERRLAKVPAERRAKTILTGSEINLGRSVRPNEQDLLGFQSRTYRPGEPLRTVVINATLFPRSVFTRVLFDPQLMYGYDEVDFTTQAVAHGYTIIPCFEAANLHCPSELSRDGYRVAATASRLYVTLKRRSWTERSPVKAWTGFGIATAHLYLASARKLGPRAGFQEAWRCVGLAWRYYRSFHRLRLTPPDSEPMKMSPPHVCR